MTNHLHELSNAMAESVAQASPSVVRVDGRRRLSATGIIWSADGVIVTAHHVVERDENINITVDSGATYEASLIGRNPANDIAVLKVDADLVAGNWAEDNALRVGNLVLALGRPGNQVQATLGITSALVTERKSKPERSRERGSRHHRRWHSHGFWGGGALADGFIQTDVVMYPGFSGGPLVGSDGIIYGMNTSGFARGASIAVPVSSIRKTVQTLVEHGSMRQGYLGVGIQPAQLPQAIAEELEQEVGLLVVSIQDDSPAQQAGVLVGDIITSLNEDSIEQIDDLMSLLQGDIVDREATLTVVRGGAKQDLSVVVTERK